MKEITRVLRCNHCGAVLQCENPSEEGYIRKDVFEYHGDRILYCESCYSKKMINNAKEIHDVNQSVYEMLRDAAASDALVIYVIDLVAFNGTLKPELVKLLKKLNVLVIANKRDLLPEKADDEVIKESIKQHFNDEGINPVDIIIVSASKNYRIEDLKKAMSDFRRKRDIYLIGSVISGKTTIIDKLLMNYENKTKRKVEQIQYPGTNIKVLSIPLDNSSNLYELPGLELNDSVLGIVEKGLINKYILPKKSLKERKFKLNKNESLVIGGLAIYVNKSEQTLECKAYFSDKVEIKKVNKSALTVFFKTNLLKRELRPVSDNLQTFEQFDLMQCVTENDGEYREIGIKGLGWVSYKSSGQTIHILIPRGAGIKEGKARIKIK